MADVVFDRENISIFGYKCREYKTPLIKNTYHVEYQFGYSYPESGIEYLMNFDNEPEILYMIIYFGDKFKSHLSEMNINGMKNQYVQGYLGVIRFENDEKIYKGDYNKILDLLPKYGYLLSKKIKGDECDEYDYLKYVGEYNTIEINILNGDICKLLVS